MDEKRGQGRSKRPAKEDAGKWDCTVCTFKNPPEAFKCEICDVRKGTSTRKPRINPAVAAAQQASQTFTTPPPPGPPPPKKEKLAAPKKERSSSTNSNSSESTSSRLSENEDVPSTHAPEEKVKETKDEPKDEPSTTSNPKKPKTSPSNNNKTSAASHASTATTARKSRPPRLKNIDRSTAQHMAVTVNNITVIITDFKPKQKPNPRAATDTNAEPKVKTKQNGDAAT